MKRGLFIPEEILDDRYLSLQEKVLLAKIAEFEKNGKPCFLSNAAIGDLLGLEDRQAREILYGLIRKRVVVQTKFDGKRRFLDFVEGWQENAKQGGGVAPCRVAEKRQAGWRNSAKQGGGVAPHKYSKLNPSTKDNKINDRRQAAANQPTIEEREEAFRESVNSFADTWQRSLLDEFIDYWTEHGKGDKKMRFEKQSSFDTSRRLARWDKNDVDKGRPSRKIVASRPDTRPTMGLKIL